jgi:integrase
MVTTFPFTEARIRALKPPTAQDPNGRDYHKDSKCPGLQLAVFPTGKKVYYFVKRMDGKPTRLKLGTTKDLSADDARELAKVHAGKVASGENPQAARRARREEPLLSALWEAYLELHAKARKKTWQDDERMYKKYMGPLVGKRLSAVTKPMVAKWHGQLAKDHGPIQANRCKALLATMFSKASAAVGYSGTNPCIGVANFAERSRERFLLPAEMKAFFTALASEDEIWREFFILCLFTGSRRGNVASMRWEEIDLANAMWHVPADKTKNKRPGVVALSPPALMILQKRREQADGCEWVFPSGRTDGHVIDPRKSWERILSAMRCCPKCGEMAGAKPKQCPKCNAFVTSKQTKCPACKENVAAPAVCRKCEHKLPDAASINLHMHDLRRSLGSWQAALGASLVVIGKSLGHADLKSTQVYSRLQLDPIKESVSRAADAMMLAAGVNLLDVKPVKEDGDNG